jgi:hypothetical protein
VNSIYVDSLKKPDISAQRDYIYDSRSRYSGSGLPTGPFVQCGLEPISIYGATVNEMLIQSHEGKIRIFPAYPDMWPGAFKLRARGAFIVAAEKRRDATIPGVRIESIKGLDCKVVNPWPGQKVRLTCVGEKKSVFFRSETTVPGEEVISFSTEPGKTYIVAPRDKKGTYPAGTVFGGERNTQPKRFHEATLGKERDF